MVRETLEQFIKLQGYDSRIHEVEALLAQIPEMLKASRTSFEKVKNEKEADETELAGVKAEMLSAKAESEKAAGMLANAQTKLTSVQNNKEYEAALKELDSLKKSIADAEIRVSSANKRMDELTGIISEKQQLMEEKQTAYLSEKEEKEEENKALFDELSTLKKLRKEYAEGLKKSIISKYERIRAARHNIAIVALSGEVCTGCYMKIPPQLAVEVKKEKELLQCPYCQRFLYSPKSDCAQSEPA